MLPATSPGPKASSPLAVTTAAASPLRPLVSDGSHRSYVTWLTAACPTQPPPICASGWVLPVRYPPCCVQCARAGASGPAVPGLCPACRALPPGGYQASLVPFQLYRQIPALFMGHFWSALCEIAGPRPAGVSCSPCPVSPILGS